VSTESLKTIEQTAEHEVGLDTAPRLKPRVGVNLWTGNLVGSLVIIGLGAYMVVSSFGFGFGTLAKPGAGIFPAAIGGVLLVLGLIWVMQVILGLVRREGDSSTPDARGAVRIGISVAVILGFSLLLGTLGYQLTMLAAMLILLFFVARTKWWLNLILAFVFAAGTFLLFDFVLGVHLPVSQIPLLKDLGL
jgi:hypothetical protein